MTNLKSSSISSNNHEQPIVALASGPGGALSILRLSGQGCHELFFQVVHKKSNGPWAANRLTLSYLTKPGCNEWIDEPMAVIFNGPHSFTGEDSAEVYLHGSPYVVELALNALFSVGFREALPGEFTRRAFLNGKIDLTKGEGIGALIQAQSKQQWLAAKQLMEGKLEKKVISLRALALEALAFLEARIDFPEEEETSALSLKQIEQRVQKVYSAVCSLMETYESGKVSSQGLKVALLGPPNAGKSTLMNTLLQSERAIVTQTPGTTRDYLEESLLVNGRLIKVIDTAGLRKSSDPIEKEGIERSLKISKEADLLLFLIPCDLTSQEWKTLQPLIQSLPSKKLQLLETKVDLQKESSKQKQLQALPISCMSSKGISELKKFLAKSVDSHIKHGEDHVMITNARHKKALDLAHNSLQDFFAKLHQNEADEILAFELQQGVKHLSSIMGELNHEQVFDKIFSDFCIGK